MGVSLKRIVAGDGKNNPSRGQTVTVHYQGYYLNPKNRKERILFDSSRKRKRPFKFRVHCGEVIPGWDDGVSKMSLGERVEITMTQDCAYGKHGFANGFLIPGDATLVFDVELLGFS